MFTLDSIELALYGGLFADTVPDQLKNQFVLHPGHEQIDNRLYVRISLREVCFFYYDTDYDQIQVKNEKDSNTKDTVYMREVGSISLTRPKDTGNDILAFPQNYTGLYLYKESEKGELCFQGIRSCNENWSKRFWGFPFVDWIEWEKERSGGQDTGDAHQENQSEVIIREEEFRCFLRFCLLCFVYEFENRAMAFGESPIYDEVRAKLRMSDVYGLLSSKIHYTLYLFDSKRLSLNSEQYSFHAQKYADRLMDKKINKVIAPENYVSFSPKHETPGIWKEFKRRDPEDIQEWFYNPEEELECVLEKNRNHLVDTNNNPGAASLKASLVSKIRSFLYTKHAVYQAMTSIESKKWFCGAQCLMGVFNLILIITLLTFNSRFGVTFFNSFLFFVIPYTLIVVFCIYKAGRKNGQNLHGIINAFFPRIIVAEAAAWLTIGIAEDLIKSMLWVRFWPVLFAVIFVLGLVAVLLYGETQQHSPYCKTKNITKTLLVLNHALYFALVLGCCMQLVFYDNLLRTSNVLSDVIYKEHFDNVEDYLQRLEDLEKSIEDYRVFARDYEFGHTQLSGNNTGKTGIKGNLRLFKEGTVVDSLSLFLENRIGVKTTLNPAADSSVNGYHNALIHSILSLSSGVKELQTRMNDKRRERGSETLIFSVLGDSLVLRDLDSTSIIDVVIDSNMDRLARILPALLKEIRLAKQHLMDDSYDVLIGWATHQVDDGEFEEDINLQSEGGEESLYLQELVDLAKAKKCCVLVSPCKQTAHRFYPTLLILHTLIVLVLAFFTQLIISDKSVTEPL